MDIDRIFQRIKPVWCSYKDHPHVEFEFRLGRLNRGKFDSNVGEIYYETMLDALNIYKGWDRVVESTYIDYYNPPKRVRVDELTDDITAITKSKITVSDFQMKNKALDVRFALSNEIPLEYDENEEMDYEISKHTYSFIRKNLSIDVTKSMGLHPSEIDREDIVSYQIELEILNPSEIKTINELYNITYKIQNVLDVISS